MTQTIVKVQKPLSSTMPKPFWVVYAEGRRHPGYIEEDDVPKRVKDALAQRKGTQAFKAFFYAERINNTWQLGEIAPDQEW